MIICSWHRRDLNEGHIRQAQLAQLKWLGGLVCAALTILAACGATPAAQPSSPSTPVSTKPAGSASAKVNSTSASAATAKPSAGAVTSVAGASGQSTVNVAVFGGSADSGVYIAEGRGYFKDVGLTIKFAENLGGNQMIPFLASGQLDVGGAAAGAAFYNAVNSGVNVKIVADKGRLSPGQAYEGLVVRKDLVGTIKSFADLKNKKVAIFSKANIDEVLLSDGLKTGNLTLKDVDIQEMPDADMVSALTNKSIDAAMLVEPFISRVQSAGIGALLENYDRISPNHQVGVLYYSPKFIANKTAAQNFMVAYVRGLRDYNDAFVKNKNRAATVDLLTKYTTVKDPKVWAEAISPGLNPDGALDMKSLASDAQYYLGQGFLKQKVDLNQIVDNSFVDYAVGKLGKYTQ